MAFFKVLTFFDLACCIAVLLNNVYDKSCQFKFAYTKHIALLQVQDYFDATLFPTSFQVSQETILFAILFSGHFNQPNDCTSKCFGCSTILLPYVSLFQNVIFKTEHTEIQAQINAFKVYIEMVYEMIMNTFEISK